MATQDQKGNGSRKSSRFGEPRDARTLRFRSNAIILIIVLGLGLIIASIGWFQAIRDLNQINAGLDEIRSQSSQDAREMGATQAALEAELDAAGKQADELNRTMETLENEIAAFSSRNAEVQQLEDELLASEAAAEVLGQELQDTRMMLAQLEQAALCQNTSDPQIDYATNSTISTSLKTWLEETQEPITDRNWETLWDGSRNSIHQLSGETLWAFYVMIDNPDENRSVFWLNQNCFLDIR